MPCGPSEPHSAREPHPRSALKRCPSAPPESLCAATTVAPQAPADGDRLPWTGLSDNHQQQHVHACPECLLLTGHREGGDHRGTPPRRPREPLCGPRVLAARSPLVFLSQAGRAGGRLAGPAPRAFALPSREDPGPAGGQWGAGKGRGQSWPGLGGPHAPHSPARPPCRVPCQAYAVMLALSEDAPSQSPLDAWLNVTGAAPESGAFDPVNHL